MLSVVLRCKLYAANLTDMKNFLAVLALGLSIAAHAQINGYSGNSGLFLEGGSTFFRPGLDFAGRFDPLMTFGISGNVPAGGRGYNMWEAHGALHIYVPQKISSLTDSSSLSVKGWELMTGLLGYDFLQNNRIVDVVGGTGFYWGQLFMRSNSNGESAGHKYVNPFIAPMARLDLRIVLGPVSFGGRVSYRYDITNDNWKRKSSNAPEIPGYHFRDLQFMAHIGYVFSE